MFKFLTVFFAFILCCSAAVTQSTAPAGLQQALEQWKSAVSVGDTAAIQSLYSINPPAHVISPDGKQQFPIINEQEFWGSVLSSGMSDMAMTVRDVKEQQGLEIATLQVSFRTKTANGTRSRYVIEQQGWQQQAGGWRMIANTRTPVLKMRPPDKLNPHLYDTNADAKVEIQEAVKKAAAEHKRVILMFGGNWCYDCHVLDAALHEPDVAPMARNFEVVHVDIGTDPRKNADLIEKYRIPIEKGVPALAILSDTGALLYSQQHGEFESARSMDPDDLIQFLEKWKAAAK